MKKTDITMIILIASMSALFAYFGAKAIMGDRSFESVTVKTIEPISEEVTSPDETVFNDRAINPTVEIFIGDKQAGSQ